ncbi:MAG: hypothetical protein ABI143_13020 [Caldimonas sp.]
MFLVLSESGLHSEALVDLQVALPNRWGRIVGRGGRISSQFVLTAAARLLDLRSGNAPTILADVATDKEDVRDGPAARFAEDDVCGPDAPFCEMREPMGNGLLVAVGHVMESGERTSLSVNPQSCLRCVPSTSTTLPLPISGPDPWSRNAFKPSG